nr:hypothetical protein BaRGS_024958 [Batillaria attramentaria]
MDLVLVQTPSQQHYSFLSVTWGIVADIDFESEKYRNLGEARFTLGAIKRIVRFEEETVHAAKKDGEAVPTPLLPPLDQPVPDNWVVEEGKFVLACAVYQTHLGSDMLAAPSSRMADGIIHLMFVRDGISRNHLLNLFLTFSEGTHVDSPYVEFVPVLAFRLEPDISSGNIMIDGERLDPVPVQGQVLPGVARVMAIQ